MVFFFHLIDLIDKSTVLANITGLRGGVGATLASINSQLPFPYVHIIYWVIQIYLVFLAVETGKNLAVDLYVKKNGYGMYSPNDDTVTWPRNSMVWYFDQFISTTASNVIFALFTEGLLKITEKMCDPLSKEDTSFSETAYGYLSNYYCA
jgi:hypothetical protein